LGGQIVALQFSDALKENEKFKDVLEQLQHYTSCTEKQFELIEDALSEPNTEVRHARANDGTVPSVPHTTEKRTVPSVVLERPVSAF
jgi:hypothetical protein